MSRDGATILQSGDTGLLESAIGYALATVQAVAPEFLTRPTPCRGWDLRMLLVHASESLAALHEGIGTGCVGPGGPIGMGGLGGLGGLVPAAGDDDPVRAFRDRAGRLLDAWTAAGDSHRVIAIAGRPLAASVVAGAGALEIAVHGWDVSRACGHCQPIPHGLALDLLQIAPLLIPETGRHPLFAAPVTVGPTASPSDQVAAFLGRATRTGPNA